MGVLDKVVKTLIIVKADTSDARAQTRALRGEEKAAAKARLDELEAQNKATDAHLEKWVKFGAVAAGAVGVFRLASKAAQAAMDDATKAGTAGSGAAKSWADATEKWHGAVNDLMVGFGKLVIKLAPLVSMMAELASSLATIVDLLNSPARARKSILDAFNFAANVALMGPDAYAKQLVGNAQRSAAWKGAWNRLPDDFFTAGHFERHKDITEKFWGGFLDAQAGFASFIGKATAKKGKPGALQYANGRAIDLIGGFQESAGAVAGAATGLYGAAKDVYANAGKVTLGEEDQTGLARLRALLEQAKRDVAGFQAEMSQMAAQRRQSFLESIFGPVEQFNVYATAFGLLQGAVTSAFDAWITGQASIGEAVKASIAVGLKAVAIDAGIQALKNTAYGFAALATGPIGATSAAGYFTAAAQFAGVAAVAGVAAKEMYAAGWAAPLTPTPSGGGGGGGYRGGSYLGGGAEGSGGQVVIMLGSDFGMLSTIEQKALLSSAIRQGLSRTRGTKRVRRGS